MACHKPAVLFSHAAIVDFIQSFWTFLLSRVNTRLQQEDQATAQIVQRSAPASALAALTNNSENEELLEVTANLLVELLQVDVRAGSRTGCQAGESTDLRVRSADTAVTAEPDGPVPEGAAYDAERPAAHRHHRVTAAKRVKA